MKVTFAPGNKVRYWQDFAPNCGLPAGVEFDAEAIGNYSVRLRASGNGLPGKHLSEYGAGAIYVLRSDWPRDVDAPRREWGSD